MNSKERNFVCEYLMSDNTALYDVYKSYSVEKEKAYNWCREKMYRQGQQEGFETYCFRIISANTFNFTVAWTVKDSYGTEWLHVETSRNTYEFRY